ncbi:peptidyl-tRNA hydrolase ict1, mitochondrial-like [Plakobranchus ocellatus]|uniref:Large ribosomal subunit protein mL62 n=1 Tax=Plakobranchus ocellatus TaxID=259542 RepID=A0AAV4ADH7_9GAST|nr:peptidyl-tRNA hydrolase ict1, mitochondrial-like [Plakobranchus ocellatus]
MFRTYSVLRNLSRQCNRRLLMQRENPASSVACGYKSHVSIDQLYPSSNPDFLRKKTEFQNEEQTLEKFEGFIPVDQLEISASRSSGPGGQHVNKVNSKVEMRFHLQTASWIPDWIKPRLLQQEHGRVTKDGFFVVRSDMTRKQMLNQADCLNKLRNMIYKASELPPEPTDEEIQLKQKRMAKAKAGVLREKRNRSLIKQNRTSPEF